jgi:hypothetical protein
MSSNTESKITTAEPAVQAADAGSTHDHKQLSGDDAERAVALEQYVPGSAEEKRLVRKLDFILLPWLWWLYILAYLDRGNVVSLTKVPCTLRSLLTIESRPMPMPLV